ncbi:hypothetical protein B4907_21595 [Yersinia kristensenii]|nr:hypothetical protein B4907_21595 [Yersinia kristensenii]
MVTFSNIFLLLAMCLNYYLFHLVIAKNEHLLLIRLVITLFITGHHSSTHAISIYTRRVEVDWVLQVEKLNDYK